MILWVVDQHTIDILGQEVPHGPLAQIGFFVRHDSFYGIDLIQDLIPGFEHYM